MRNSDEPVNRLTNSDIHHYATENGVWLYEIADRLEISTAKFFRELSESEMKLGRKTEVLRAIDLIRRTHEDEERDREAFTDLPQNADGC